MFRRTAARRPFVRRRAPELDGARAVGAGKKVRRIVLPPKVPKEAKETLGLIGLGKPELVTPELLSTITSKIKAEQNRADSLAEAAKGSFGTAGFREEAESSRARANALIEVLKTLKQLKPREWEEE